VAKGISRYRVPLREAEACKEDAAGNSVITVSGKHEHKAEKQKNDSI
jgi:hypothetical protein